MTTEQAEAKALEWQTLHDDAQCEEENECESAAMSLREQARAIEDELELAGYNPGQLLRQIAFRRNRQ